jgi:hypothetical protein
MQCELMIEVVILTPKNKDMIMVIVKVDPSYLFDVLHATFPS